jgi:hypothetical protein
MGGILIGLGVGAMVEGDFNHIGPCVKLFDGKVSQTTMFIDLMWLGSP